MPSNSIKKKTINQLVVEPEGLGRIFNILIYILEQKNEESVSLKELFESIVKNIITPLIVMTPQSEIENIFDRYVSPFQTQLKKLIEIINREELDRIEISEMENFGKDFANMIERDFRTEPKIGQELFDTIETYNEYAVTLLKNDKEKPDVLEDVLSYKIDLNDFQKYTSGSLLAFFCTLASYHTDKDAKVLLSIFFNIAKIYNHNLLDYVKTIDYLCNPEKVEEAKELIHTNPKMAKIIGKSLISNLPTDFKIQHKGLFIAIKYNGEVLAESDTLEKLHDQINRQGVEDECYIERIGYNYIAKIEL